MNRQEAINAFERNALVEQTVEGEDGYERVYTGYIVDVRRTAISDEALVRWHKGFASWVNVKSLEIV